LLPPTEWQERSWGIENDGAEIFAGASSKLTGAEVQDVAVIHGAIIVIRGAWAAPLL
jgi:hypothetical protein